MERKYLPRVLEPIILDKLRAKGCVVIEGPKWCGKSTTGRRYAKTIVELGITKVNELYRTYSDMGDPSLFKGEKPLMYDEWQNIPELWDSVRTEIDRTGLRGQFILTGSATPPENENRHPGTGRIAKLVMRPMSLWESNESTGEVSLTELFYGKTVISGTNKYTLDRLAYLVCRGGWPEIMIDDEQTALQAAFDYVSTLITEDITRLKGLKCDPQRAAAILKAYARSISQAAKLTTIKGDVEANDDTIDPRTLESYITAFERMFVIQDVEAWSPSLRSKSTVRSANTRQFVDPSIATAALGITPNDLVSDLKTFGFMFESLATRDLRVYAESLGGKVYQYHDNTGLEADLIIHFLIGPMSGKWGAIEVKLGGDKYIEEGAKHLLTLRERVNTEKMKAPTFLMVVTGTQHAYRRPDDVYVVPLACLKN